MARSLFAVIIALLILTACDGSCGQAPSTESRLEAAVASNATTFDFASDSAFDWDRMYIFACYSSRESVETALGFTWPDFGKTTIQSSDSVLLVVFVQNGEVVGWYEQPRTIDVIALANDRGYARSEAVFDVDRSSGRPEVKPPSITTAPADPAD